MTQNRKLSCMLPRKLFVQFNQWKANQQIMSDSGALIALMESFFASESAYATKSELAELVGKLQP
ncbi:MAG: hypothetical protein SFT94_10695 [Pseudanabaenaceae cyanobacterium bins.68]|nr:hypothetical protein [Pseudanabaenaceae cyanobacterium bins.68]